MQNLQANKLLTIPHSDTSIARGRVNKTLSAPFDRSNHVRMPAIGKYTLSRPRIPYFNQLILRRSAQSFAFPSIQMKGFPADCRDEFRVGIQWISRHFVS